MTSLKLSRLPKTWILDVDGTIFKHWSNNVPIPDEAALPGVKEFLEKNVTKGDTVVLLSARKKEFEDMTIASLKRNGIRFDHLIVGLPIGERILINDEKPSIAGKPVMKTAYAVNVKRDEGMGGLEIRVDGDGQ